MHYHDAKGQLDPSCDYYPFSCYLERKQETYFTLEQFLKFSGAMNAQSTKYLQMGVKLTYSLALKNNER